MKRLALLLLGIGSVGTLCFAGTETKDMKQVAPVPPPECNWTGFYIGIHGGGQWGHSEARDDDGYYSNTGNTFGFDQSGAVVGGQLGYNWQWKWLVLGPEVDLGYMDIDGSGVAGYDRANFDSDTKVSNESDFYMTARGRLGFALDKWLFYAT